MTLLVIAFDAPALYTAPAPIPCLTEP